MNMVINGDLLAIMLLYSLPASYENFRCAIETRDDLPSAESLKIKIIEETEARKQNSVSDIVAMTAVPRKNFNGQGGKNIQRRVIKCFKCGVIGHKANECQKKKGKVLNNISNESFFCGAANDYVGNIQGHSWILDSGCTTHLCGDKQSFVTMCESSKTKINLANEACADVKGLGTVQLSTEVNNDLKIVKLENTLYVPDLRSNLISIAKIVDRGYQVIFTKREAQIYNNKGALSLIADRKGDLFFLRESTECAVVREKGSDFLKWHYRLGHLNTKDMIRLIGNNILPRMECTALNNCEICMRGKMTATPFSQTHQISSKPLHIIYSDVVGPFRIQSTEGAKYFVTFVDDCTRWCEVYFLREKGHVFEVFQRYQRYVEKHFGRKIKFLHSNYGGEYVNNSFNKYLFENGIRRRLTIPHTPQQNGVAERLNRTLLDMARCLMLQSNLSPSFWSAAVATACHLRNRCPTRSLDWSTPYEKYMGKKPTLDYIRVFGSKVMVLDKDHAKSKMASRSMEGVFVGYPNDRKGYRIWIPSKRQFIFSRDVKFVAEDKYKEPDVRSNSENSVLLQNNEKDVAPIKSFTDIEIELGNQNFENYVVESQISENVNVEDVNSPVVADLLVDIEIPEIDVPLNSNGLTKRAPGRPKIIRTGNRGRPRKEFRMVEHNGDVSSGNETEPDEDVFENARSEEFAGVAEIKIQDALKSDEREEWINAIESEVTSLIKKDTWKIVNVPDFKNVVGCRFILTNKCDADGNIQRRKARLVAKGYSQEYGVNYFNTFAPVARLDTLRLMLDLSGRFGYTIWQFDVVTAYLNGVLEEESLMKVPDMIDPILERIVTNKGESSEVGIKALKMIQQIRNNDGKSVCKLKKALYGLKQAGRQWYSRLTTKLKSMGLVCTKNEPCLYFGNIDKEPILLLVYVDDILVASKSKDVFTKIKEELSKEFELKDLGQAKYCLGLEIEQVNNEIILHQKGYINEILRKYNMFHCNSIATPAEVNMKLHNTGKACDESKYRELVGMLMYLSVATRPDISNIISKLAQFVNKPLDTHWNAAKKVLRYLSGSKEYVLRFRRTDDALIAYTDADWGGCLIDRRSYTGYVFILSGAPITWKSQKQRTVALSSTEAEYVSLAEAAKEAIYLRSLLLELKLDKLGIIKIYVDNKGAEFLASNPGLHSRTKHIDIRHHFLRESMNSKLFTLQHVSTQDKIADIMTKALPKITHYNCMQGIGFLL